MWQIDAVARDAKTEGLSGIGAGVRKEFFEQCSCISSTGDVSDIFTMMGQENSGRRAAKSVV